MLPIKLASLVQHWTAHPNRFGETRPEFANSLRQIASVLKRLNSHLQLQGVSNQLTAYLQEAAQEQCEQPSIPTLAG